MSNKPLSIWCFGLPCRRSQFHTTILETKKARKSVTDFLNSLIWVQKNNTQHQQFMYDKEKQRLQTTTPCITAVYSIQIPIDTRRLDY